jgi:exodeoxyribonuclease V alpha subunit
MTPTQASALRSLRAAGGYDEFDLQLAGMFARQDAALVPAVLWAIASLSRQIQRGAVCLDLAGLVEEARAAPLLEFALPADEADWRALLCQVDAVGAPGQIRPLILDEAGRLYGYRHWDLEQRLARALCARVGWAPIADREPVQRALLALFPGSEAAGSLQALAAVLAATGRITLLTGGPGTGKTTALARMLALLLHVQPTQRIALAAPTGKAAARMQEALGGALARLPEDWRLDLPVQATTLHRLLGIRPGAGHLPRFHAEHPLPVDVLVLDEASMVDLALMTRLIEALPETARLILLGDPDQLASVGAGAVLGDLCEDAAGFSAEQAGRLRAWTGGAIPAAAAPSGNPLSDHRVHLTHNHRFGDSPGLAALAAAVNAGDAGRVARLVAGEGQPEVTAGVEADLIARALQGYEPYLAALARGAPVEEVLACFEQFRVLCAPRAGPLGVEGLNARIEAALRRRGSLRGEGLWTAGRPVLVTRNDPGARLANGDVGLVLPGRGGRLEVVFRHGDGAVHAVSPARLGAWETAFAMTIHKTQGSEFDAVLLVLPEEDSPLLTRNLLYTGITRARRRLHLVGAVERWAPALARRQRRISGLGDALRRFRAVSPVSE